MKQIIFICKYNAFRSRIAENYFKKINKNKKISAISAGFIMDEGPDRTQISGAKKIAGIDISRQKAVPVKMSDLRKVEKIIVVAYDIPEIMFNNGLYNLKKKLEIWKIPDEQKGNSKNIERIIKNIMKKVEKLNKELNKK
ncbi:MAG: hypothetical protein Q8P15_04000 [Nanoarchaeota archaeon]|nr:hypothetical protein [Nanoarchaeota archaeon]